jgi:hypothetical protein
MPKSQQTEEVRILRFFEEAPLEQAEMLFNIVREKMRARSPTHSNSHRRVGKKKEHLPASSAGEEEDRSKLIP